MSINIKSQKGFGAVEAIIVLLVLLVLGAAGWYVWNGQQDENKSASSQTQGKNVESEPSTLPTQSKQQASDPTADWATYSNTAGHFSFKYPKTWVFADRPEACAEGHVLFAANSDALGRCASESFGQMIILSVNGDVRGNYKLGAGYRTDYTGVTETAATADTVNGTKQTATAFGQQGVGVLPDGTKVVQYAFYTNGRTYIAEYTQRSTYPDALNDFESLVTRTLQFTK